MADKQPPTGVKVISVLYYIGAALSLIIGILFLIGSTVVEQFADSPAMGAIGKVIVGIGGILFLIFAVLSFFVARGLWKGQNWAKIVSIILAVLGVLGSLTTLFAGNFTAIIQIAINGWIAYYLIANKEAKAFFEK